MQEIFHSWPLRRCDEWKFTTDPNIIKRTENVYSNSVDMYVSDLVDHYRLNVACEIRFDKNFTSLYEITAQPCTYWSEKMVRCVKNHLNGRNVCDQINVFGFQDETLQYSSYLAEEVSIIVGLMVTKYTQSSNHPHHLLSFKR